MKRIQILKNSVVTNQADFDTDNEAQAWLIQEIDNGSFGLTERWVKESECSAEDLAASLENRLVEPEFDESYTEHRLPAEFSVVEIDLDNDAEYQAAVSLSQKLALGKIARACCDEVYDLIAGYNLSRSLTSEQIDSMESTFTPVAQALGAKRPDKAKVLIAAITPDGTLVTQEMIDDVNAVFTRFGL